MNIYNVYRTLTVGSKCRKIPQLIGKVAAESYDLALLRAGFIANFNSWDGNPGRVVLSSDPQPEEIYPSGALTESVLDGSYENISRLQSNRRLREVLREKHSREMSSLNNDFNILNSKRYTNG